MSSICFYLSARDGKRYQTVGVNARGMDPADYLTKVRQAAKPLNVYGLDQGRMVALAPEHIVSVEPGAVPDGR